MQMRLAVVIAVLVASIGLLVSNAPVSAAGNCLGHQATVVPVGHTYTLTAGDDVVVGTSAADEVTTIDGAGGGTDYICTGNGDDFVNINVVEPIAATVRTGNGDDFVGIYGSGTIDVDLGNGDDTGTTSGELAGSFRGSGGNDGLRFQGGSAVAGATVDGGSGHDYVQSSAAEFVYGGSGNDTVIEHSANGATLVDCGSGRDVFYAANAATVRRCETPF
jgi:hypothetical protein